MSSLHDDLAYASYLDSRNEKPSISRDRCIWTETEECYETSCGKSFCMTEGSPNENDMFFCCFCGRPLEERRM